jgi:hypothetical protein
MTQGTTSDSDDYSELPGPILDILVILPYLSNHDQQRLFNDGMRQLDKIQQVLYDALEQRMKEHKAKKFDYRKRKLG